MLLLVAVLLELLPVTRYFYGTYAKYDLSTPFWNAEGERSNLFAVKSGDRAVNNVND